MDVMKKTAGWFLVGVLCILGAMPAWAAQGDECDRTCLTGVLNDYLAALTGRDPGKAPVAAQYRATEDALETRLGQGLWKTATGLGAYRIDMADPASGNVGYIGEVLEGDRIVGSVVYYGITDVPLKGTLSFVRQQ